MTNPNASTSPNYSLEQITDQVTRDVLKNITSRLDENVMLGFKGKHVQIEKIAGTYDIPHKLGFVPRDAWVTGITIPTGTASVVFDYDSFTKTHFRITVTTSVAAAAASMRLMLGRMKEEGY